MNLPELSEVVDEIEFFERERTPEAASMHEHRYFSPCVFVSASPSPTMNAETIQEVRSSQWEKSTITPSQLRKGFPRQSP